MQILFVVLYTVLYVAGVAFHPWTTYIAYKTGFVATIATFFCPIVAEVYWFVSILATTGTLLNPYCLAALSLAAGYGLVMFLANRMESSKEDKETVFPVKD